MVYEISIVDQLIGFYSAYSEPVSSTEFSYTSIT